ncbi:hypothetical protein ACF1A9_25885 [Streptomyces sp. NPDC014872]|uniref:hypothetical protein n=1 Tax=Streptomyces sp. NPDC014872 TaxID=3364926 RepID=UPI0036F9EF52
MACARELFDEVGALTDCHDPGIADDLPEPFEVVEGLFGIKGGQSAGVLAEPIGKHGAGRRLNRHK